MVLKRFMHDQSLGLYIYTYLRMASFLPTFLLHEYMHTYINYTQYISTVRFLMLPQDGIIYMHINTYSCMPHCLHTCIH